MNPTRRAIEMLLNRAAGPVVNHIIRTRMTPTESQIERELAEKYGEIAEQMKGVTPKPEPERKVYKEESLQACFKCVFEHLGEVKGALEHASGREPGSEEFEAKITRAVDKLLECEREHLGPKDPENARRIREIRKAVESHIGPGKPSKSLGEIVSEVDRIRPEMRRLWHESAGEEEVEAAESAEKETLRHLDRFVETKDVAHLRRAREAIAGTGCKSCVRFVSGALDAMEEGDEDEAMEWVRGIRRGLRISR